MELFSKILKKYKVTCFDILFDKLIIKKFKTKKENKKEELYCGFHDKLKELESFNIILLSNESEETLAFLKERREKINFFTLSHVEKEHLEKYHIKSKVIKFDFIIKSKKDRKKLIYFNKNTSDNSEFQNYIDNCKHIFEDVKLIKFIFSEPIKSINNPYINVAITTGVEVENINYYFLNFYNIIQSFKKEYSNFYEKYYNYKKNFININVFLDTLNNMVRNKVFDETLHKKLSNFFTKNYHEFIVISDKPEYLSSLKPDTFKILISDNHILKKIENNYIAINSYFFDYKYQKKLKHSDNKYTFFLSEADIYHFIIEKEDDIKFLDNYIILFNKYNIKKRIKIYSEFEMKIQYNGHISYHNFSEFDIENNCKIYYSASFDINRLFDKIIMKDNVECKKMEDIMVLVSSTQYPSYGGAATNTYNIIKYFKKFDFIKTSGLFIDTSEDIAQKANPDNLENIYGAMYGDFHHPDITFNLLKTFGGYPDIAFCKNCMAPKIIKNIFPNCINIFLVSGIWGFAQLECGASEITDFIPIRKTPEEASIKLSNLVICNSNLTIDYFKKIYEYCLEDKLLNKPIDTTKYNVGELILKEKHEYDEQNRTIDIIAIASNANRPVKNIKFIKEILEKTNRKITVIGENTEELFNDKKSNLTIVPLLTQSEVIEYLKKSKIILIPSLFDSNSNVFREAVYNGVYPFISHNVAHPKKFPKFFICDNYNTEDWIFRIEYLLENYKQIYDKYNLIKYFTNDDDLLSFVF